jgi:Glycosyl transferase family 64 domain
MKAFLPLQISYLLRTLPYRHTWRHKLWTLVQGAHLLVGYIRLKITLRFTPRAAPIRGRTCVVVLLSHNRPQNMWLLVEGALRNRFVRRVIVSNSNPEVKIRDWVASTDSRLTLVDETTPTQPGHRLVLARQAGAEYILSIDDDIFLTPKQWKSFFEFLLADEQCPHGISGQVYRPGTKSSNGSPFHHAVAGDMEVDVLIGAYAFTSEHLKRVFELAARIGVPDLSQVRNGEDILLSFAGTTRPHIHPLKPALFCASEGLPGVALWKSDHRFWDERVRVFEKAREARLAMESVWGGREQTYSPL